MARKEPSDARGSELRRVVEDAIVALQADGSRFRSILRNTASLLEEVSAALSDAGRQTTAEAVGGAGKNLRRAALLPAAMAAALLRKALDDALARGD